ncbi:MAG: enoyl-CoA hydratase/isomerase family protein [Woeseia sp.]
MPTVELETIGSVARITLNRPDKLNAIDAGMLDELEAALDRAERSDNVRAILLDGNGRAFSAGFDMGSPASAKNGESRVDRARRELTRDFNVIMRFWDCPKPTIAAVHGFCLGSSMEITAVCDVTIAAAGCRFGAPEVRYGSGIVCLILPWIIGLKHANELLLAGNNDIDAARAAAMGLVNRVVPPIDLHDEARAMAELIAANDALAVQLTKKAIHRSVEAAGLRRALEDALEFDIQIETTDTTESIAFNDVLEREGLKAALRWRASRIKSEQ